MVSLRSTSKRRSLSFFLSTVSFSTMESQNLRTASSYINNLLLSRGLLRNGVPIEFARPDKAEGGMDATMAKIINLVHDFILRRDVGISSVYFAFGLFFFAFEEKKGAH